MLNLIIYLGVVFLLLLFLIFMSFYSLSLIYSSIMGSPYVPTRKKAIREMFDQIKIKKGSLFYELGCGDGRIIRTAVKYYHVKGVGVDINPLLILWAKILGAKNIQYKVENIFKTDLRKADYVYIFLMPKLIKDLEPKLKKELKKGTIVISHGFSIEGLKKKQIKKLVRIPFPTYYYRI